MEPELPYMPRKSEGVEPPDNWPMLLFKDLMPYARTRTRCDADAQNLAQEVVIKAGRNIDKLRDAPNMRAWLLKVMRNQLKDDRRKNKRQVPTVPLVMDVKSPDIPELLRTPNPDHWLMSLMQRATGKRREFAIMAVEEEFNEHRLALRLRELPEYTGRTIEQLSHYVRRKFQDLQEWVWSYLGLLPEVKAHQAYEMDALYKEYPISPWKEQLEKEARLLVQKGMLEGRMEMEFRESLRILRCWRSYRSTRLYWSWWEHDDLWNNGYNMWDDRLIHALIEKERSERENTPHLRARSREFSAFNSYNYGLYEAEDHYRVSSFETALSAAEESMDLFSREGLSTHFARVADHHKRIESLLKDARSKQKYGTEDMQE